MFRGKNHFSGDCTDRFQAVTADLISAAQFAFGFTKRGVNQGNAPIKSCVTKICPSQSGPLPMPMVGIEIAFDISCATGGVTSSNTMANAPAFVSA